MFANVRDLQRSINRIGLGAAVLTVPTPRMLLWDEAASSPSDIHEKYIQVVTESDILAVSRDLFVSGFYSQAVEEAFKFVDNYVKAKSRQKISGSSLMERVFSPNAPKLKLNDLVTDSEANEQAGYHRIFAGSMLGIRNPCAHENNWFSDAEAALEVIVLSQHLLRKAKAAAVSP